MTGYIAPRILHAGESCLVVEFGSAIDLGVNARVQARSEEHTSELQSR